MKSGLSFRAMNMVVAFIAAAAIATTGCATMPQAEGEYTEIRAVMDAQAAAWNSGDIDGYMAGYWRSEQLRFVFDGVVLYGWEAVRERFRTRFPDPATMGRLRVIELEVDRVSATDALAFGRGALQLGGQTRSLVFTLHFKRIDGDWVIVSDHSAAVP